MVSGLIKLNLRAFLVDRNTNTLILTLDLAKRILSFRMSNSSFDTPLRRTIVGNFSLFCTSFSPLKNRKLSGLRYKKLGNPDVSRVFGHTTSPFSEMNSNPSSRQ